ncbi:hypothetical protein JW898_00885 [Candidatus Woesearchaeota archaeon]|nr:hypothetical protein [Candidatus Woesearchaeota archaeon]
MDKQSWEQKRPAQEQLFENKVRQLMYRRRITYHEAADIVKKGQKSIWEF